MFFQLVNLVRHHFTLSALFLLLGTMLSTTVLASSDSRAIVRITSLTPVKTLPVLSSPYTAYHITRAPTSPLTLSSLLSRVVSRARQTRSDIDNTRHAMSYMLCHGRPPFFRSRLAMRVYYALSLTRSQLCHPQPSFIKSLPRSPWSTYHPRPRPVLPHLPPPATRVTRADIPPTRRRNGPAPPQPACARTRWWPALVDEATNWNTYWDGSWRSDSDLPVWASLGMIKGLLVLLIFKCMRGRMERRCERELLSAAPPTPLTPSPSPSLPLTPAPARTPTLLPCSRPCSPPRPLSTPPSSSPNFLPPPSSPYAPLLDPSTSTPVSPKDPPLPFPSSFSLRRLLLPALSFFLPIPPPPPPPPPPPETFCCSPPHPLPQRVRYCYHVRVRGYRGDSPDFFGQKTRILRIRGRFGNRTRLANGAWDAIDRLVGYLECTYRVWEDAWYETRVARETEIYELRRRSNGRYCWARATHETEVFENLKEFMTSMRGYDPRDVWDEELYWAGPNSPTPSRPQSPLGPPTLEDPHPLLLRRLVVAQAGDEEEEEGVDRGWEERVRQGEPPE